MYEVETNTTRTLWVILLDLSLNKQYKLQKKSPALDGTIIGGEETRGRTFTSFLLAYGFLTGSAMSSSSSTALFFRFFGFSFW